PIPDSNWVLVGIAYLIARRSIKIMFSNAHPTIMPIVTIKYSEIGYWWALPISLLAVQ
ncbi:MAG: hypothetical protein F6K50_29735, partial [Moorea sp. SIO3I7]|nr:hypothetical protein [Moorena sp. SIO3I7]